MRFPALTLAPFALLMLSSAGVDGSPLDEPHVGGVGFGGPTEGDLAAIYWNPAALGLLEGMQATLVVTEQLTYTKVRRASIDPASGRPGGDRVLPVASGRGERHLVSGPFSFPSFMAFGAAVGNRFTLALAAYVPYGQELSYAPADEEPARYHLVRSNLRHLALVPALAFRVGQLRFGAAPGFLLSTGRLVFDEDTALSGGSGTGGLGADCGGVACGAENPAAAARYDVASGGGLFESSLAFTVAAGLYFRRGPLALGLAYASRPLGTDGLSIEARRTRVMPGPRAGGAPLCPIGAGASLECFFGEMRYELPDTITAGVTWHLSPRLEASAILRYLTTSRHERVTLRIVGPAPQTLRAAGLPERVVLHRGFSDTMELRLRIARRLGARFRVGATLRGQSSAVPSRNINPAAVDGATVEPSLAGEGRWAWLRLTVGYGLAFTPTVTASESAFDPVAAVECADAQGDLGNPACQARLEGRARPTAAGRYGLTRHFGSLAATVLF